MRYLLVLILSSLFVGQTQAEPALLRHWTFDEADEGAASVPGVRGNAREFRGEQRMQVEALGDQALAAVTFSAWTRPTELSSYREIFRQDCPNRLLFSFQNDGTILSLGLNIGGYVECDAPIRPEDLMDGLWHHCAATFDGRWMRVYLDGLEIGALERPGKIAVQAAPPAYIGSMNGQGEFYQGGLDDLRIYASALTPADIQQLCREDMGPTDERRRKAICQRAERLLEQVCEFEPLTESQRKKLTAEERSHWEKVAELRRRIGELTSGTRPAEEWPTIEQEARKLVQNRPSAGEPVAPYVRPVTPVTRDLSAAEARAALEADWLYQAGGTPTPDRINSEIGWACQLAGRIGADCTAELGALAKLSGTDVERYFKVREIKRRILFKNPALDFDRVLLVDMPYPQGSEWPHETRHRQGYMAIPGGRLLVLSGLRDGGHLTQIMPQPPLHGSFWRPDVSFDGTKVLFCFKPHNEKSFHLYEIGADGTDLRQLTDGPYDDLDPIYLPDGHLLFTSTRGHTYVRCMPPTSAFILSRCDADGRNIYLISANNEPDYLPSLLQDGRVIYTRWEYTDKPLWRAQKLWTANPDGTQVTTFWGNQSVWPDLVKDARPIPGSGRVMVTGSAHHNWFAGSVAIVDPRRGLNYPGGLTKVTADVPWPEVGNGPTDPVESPLYHASGQYDAYYSPYPLSERDFLVSARREGKFRLYLMDTDGNRELIYEGAHSIFHALPLKPRTRPPTLPDSVAWPARGSTPAPGVVFSSNVYEGAPPGLRGKARFLRIFSIDPKTYTYWNHRPYLSTGPVVSAVQSEGVKRLLGTVPIEEDGSVAFKAPPGLPLHFQLLDAEQRALQTMRSFVGMMPGERRGCVGCHELHSRAPEGAGKLGLALQRAPQAIVPPPWPDATVSYPRYVRPVLDRYCARCHEGTGEARKVFDMTERPTAPVFTEPYMTMIGRPTWGAPYHKPDPTPPGWGIAGMLVVEGYGQTDPRAYATPQPMTALSYRSRLIEIAGGGKHHDVKVDATSLLRLIVWVDAMCPFKGDEEVRAEPDPDFPGVDWLPVRPRVATAPRILRPGPVD